ncbi:hypothetical protein BN1723_001411 [Verticillium longisporum]|uniref:Uncharacterized protein n=1 Tax=Verticillium longisporum TaxID=100787 RepID=A0A0G4NP01_VERLO|nr:hypothetical protein BN1723_001411 [Verticillium longisporum]
MSYHCKECNDPLVLELGPDSDGEEEATTVPDDLELRCGCHFHWQCLMDKSSEVAISLRCPSCQTHLATNEAGPSATNQIVIASSGSVILARYVNEAHPEARPARAYHVMCSEGDATGIVELLHDASAELGGDTVQLGHLIRYRDPLHNNKSGLHLAVEKGREEVLWLLLWLASSLPTESFPESAQNVAKAAHIGRLDTSGDDIRFLQSVGGKSAYDIAQRMPDQWGVINDSGVLRP